MANGADFPALAAQARRLYIEALTKGLGRLASALGEHMRQLLDQPAEHAVAMRRRDALQELHRHARDWLQALAGELRQALVPGRASVRATALPLPGDDAPLSLVDDDTIEREIFSSRLALAVMDRASWEFSDLRSRMSVLQRRDELDSTDILRPHVLARLVIDTWLSSGLSLTTWRELQASLHEEFALLVEEAYHETNRWMIGHNVLPNVDLRPFIRRTPTAARAGAWKRPTAPAPLSGAAGAGPRTAATAQSDAGDTTRPMTEPVPHSRNAQAQEVLGRLAQVVNRQLPGFGAASAAPAAPSPRLTAAMDEVQHGLQQRLGANDGAEPALSGPALLQELHERKQALKQAAESPVERATIEIVALLFQNILTEERIPATVRVWFARLQMPVLRVAISEPGFFATVDHPARRLIDRMGACVMGFDTSARQVGDALEKEIKRIVQVVEAYPDTGRRVFQTVLSEFESFLEHYFRNENEASRKGVSLAQQVEQREALAIQYTIELRRMLEGVPVQEGVRQFLFQVWADVLALSAVKHGQQSEPTRLMKRAAADLIWSAGAKVSREERSEVLRKLPPLLKLLREGMDSAGLPRERQDEHIRELNNSLAAAFTAKAAAIPAERLQELMERLETLEELLPDSADLKIDESVVLDLSGHESSELEVVEHGGSVPTPAMQAWARELQVGSWFMLDWRGRNEAVQLAWQGLRKQLTLFVSARGRCVLFPQQRLAAFLQAGLLLPAQDEALTVRATRTALAKLDADPQRLLN